MNIFEKAARNAFRFPSGKGLLTTEQLFTLPLTSEHNLSLDRVGKLILAAQKALGEESLVEVSKDNVERQLLDDMLEILKFIIADKQEELKAAAVRREKRQKRAKILEAIENRENADLAGKSVEELTKELEDLD